jgi:hypothetical protein
MSYSAIRPTPPIRSRPQSEIKFPDVYVIISFSLLGINGIYFRKTKNITTKNNQLDTDVFITQQQSLMHLTVNFLRDFEYVESFILIASR